MAEISWTHGDLEALVGRIETIKPDLVEKVAAVLDGVVWDAALDQAHILEKAVTPTGEARVASGRGEYPGRHVTGHMINEIGDKVVVDGDTVTGTWGWENPEGYILQQEDSDIYGAHSLHLSFIKAEQRAIDGIDRVVRGK